MSTFERPNLTLNPFIGKICLLWRRLQGLAGIPETLKAWGMGLLLYFLGSLVPCLFLKQPHSSGQQASGSGSDISKPMGL